ncbi:MAG TPA: ribbon-helix-helix protein, CopG family, partial [Nitrobacter sp.]|nr:ribbon-helix-helix protein, CopG family [Nitrobacter sp.]
IVFVANIQAPKGCAMSEICVMSVHVPKELRQKLEAKAKATDRSLAAVVRVLLNQALKQQHDEVAA